ncbi:alpha/beta hydrolase [Streptomyces sp. NPDC049954]|uniref:alpha/beta fold hydrolase n=1 Tax=Streptomyces sp. NPDC049954 TaxID=3155779 RepID=UPI00343D5BD8
MTPAGRAAPAADLAVRGHGDVRLRCRDWGGTGPGVLFLHGLAGHVGEWEATARSSRAEGWRAAAFDQRGHGGSERRPAEVGHAAQVADTVAVIRALRLAPVVLVGQSLGGRTALLTGAAHPELVRAVVLVECDAGERPREETGTGAGAQPGRDADAGPDREDDAEARDAPASAPAAEPPALAWLRSWPVPFASRTEAVTRLGGGRLGEGWADGLERRADGWWPRFDLDVMAAVLAAADTAPAWEAWTRLDRPALLVTAQHGFLEGGTAPSVRNMFDARPSTWSAGVPGAGHDVHLEQPEALHAALAPFLRALPPGAG